MIEWMLRSTNELKYKYTKYENKPATNEPTNVRTNQPKVWTTTTNVV